MRLWLCGSTCARLDEECDSLSMQISSVNGEMRGQGSNCAGWVTRERTLGSGNEEMSGGDALERCMKCLFMWGEWPE